MIGGSHTPGEIGVYVSFETKSFFLSFFLQPYQVGFVLKCNQTAAMSVPKVNQNNTDLVARTSLLRFSQSRYREVSISASAPDDKGRIVQRV